MFEKPKSSCECFIYNKTSLFQDVFEWWGNECVYQYTVKNHVLIRHVIFYCVRCQFYYCQKTHKEANTGAKAHNDLNFPRYLVNFHKLTYTFTWVENEEVISWFAPFFCMIITDFVYIKSTKHFNVNSHSFHPHVARTMFHWFLSWPDIHWDSDTCNIFWRNTILIVQKTQF
jgi:hypothetical protein